MKIRDQENRAEGSATGIKQGKAEPCDLCSGTGLVCRNTPVIDSKNCCVDYANAVCPKCKGNGVMMREAFACRLS